MGQLLKSLREYADSDHLPMHMPGHKRCMGEIGNPYFIDITEIDGFDDLHHAEGILADAQKRTYTMQRRRTIWSTGARQESWQQYPDARPSAVSF